MDQLSAGRAGLDVPVPVIGCRQPPDNDQLVRVTPNRATWALAALVAVFAVVGTFDRVAYMTAFGSLVFFALTLVFFALTIGYGW